MTEAKPKEAVLVILRHGQTDYNKDHLMTGQRDIPLNKSGEAQADAVGALIKDIRFDKVYSSPLSRAFNTVARALEASGTQSHLQNPDGSWQIEKRAELAELDAGDFTGVNYKEHPEASKPFVYDVRLPNGESKKDVVERFSKFFNAEILPRLQRGENVVVACHYFVLEAAEIEMKITPVPTANPTGPVRKIPNAAPLKCITHDGVLKSHEYIENPAANQNAPKNKAPKP